MSLDPLRKLGRAAPHHVLGVEHLVADPGVPDGRGGLVDFPRRTGLLPPGFASQALGVGLQALHVRGDAVLTLAESAHLLGLVGPARARQLLHSLRRLALEIPQLLGPALQVADTLALSCGPGVLEVLGGALEPVERTIALRRRVGRIGGGPAHRIRGFLHPARSLSQLRRIALPGKTLQPVRLRLRLPSELALLSPAALLTELNFYFAIRGFGALHQLQRALFPGQCSLGVSQSEALLRGLHLLAGGIERGMDQPEGGVGGEHVALDQPPHQLSHIGLEPALRNRERREILAPLALRGPGAVAEPVEGAGHDFALSGRKPFRGLPAAATSSGFGLLVVAAVRPHLEEVDVARGRIPGAVPRGGKVRDQISRLEPQLFEEERMGRPQLGGGASGGRIGQRDALLGATVHLVAELHAFHPVVVRSAHCHGDFFHRGDLGVAAGLLDPYGRPVIVQRLDDVLKRARYRRAVGGHEIHPVEAVPGDAEGARQASR